VKRSPAAGPALALTAALLLLWPARAALGHQLNTAFLSLVEVEPGRFSVRWQASSATVQADTALRPVFPPPCHTQGDVLDCGPTGLVGDLGFPWLAGTETYVMVDIEWRAGERLLRVVTGSAPSLRVYGIPSSAGWRGLKPIVLDYTRLGIEHILTGVDHLLFVLALLLLVKSGKRLLAAVTAFTLAHSLTLACAVLDLVRLPSPPVEATIALSIVLLCGECLRRTDSLARRAPWIATFAFGLVHGLGFASALQDIGLPQNHVPAALGFFNVGVELGQLGIIAAATGLRLLARRLRAGGVWLERGLVYAMGATAAFWSIERVLLTLGGR
jgi:hydrogenase/urease accessory protein HupE